MELSLPAFLCSPGEGARFLHGRAWPLGAPTPLSVYVTQQTHQHECMNPADGSYVVADVGVMDHAGARELRVDGVAVTGGTMVALGMAPEAAGGPVALGFEPRAVHLDDRAAALAQRLFPELLAALAAAGQPPSGVTVVEGTLVLRATGGGATLLRDAWRPLSVGGAGGGVAAGSAGASPPPGTVAELLARTWEGSNAAAGTEACGGGHAHTPNEGRAAGAGSPAAAARPAAAASAGGGGGGGWVSSRSYAARSAAAAAAAATGEGGSPPG